MLCKRDASKHLADQSHVRSRLTIVRYYKEPFKVTTSDPAEVQLNALQTGFSVKNATTAVLNEPKLGVILGDLLELADTVGLCSSLGNSVSGSLQDNVEVHTENTSGGIVLNSEIDMLVNTESEVAYSI